MPQLALVAPRQREIRRCLSLGHDVRATRNRCVQRFVEPVCSDPIHRVGLASFATGPHECGHYKQLMTGSANVYRCIFLNALEEEAYGKSTQKSAQVVKDSSDITNRGTGAEEPSSVSSSLLERLKVKSPEAWRRLIYLFGPLVYQRCRQNGLQPADASDVFQDVFRAVATDIGSFRRDRPGDTFRGWLWTITRNKLADFWDGQQKHPQGRGGSDALKKLESLAAGDPVEVGQPSDPGTPGSLYQRALRLVQDEFEGQTWKAFWRVSVDGCSPADVADELGMSVNAVYIAKTRVLRRLRQELGDLLD